MADRLSFEDREHIVANLRASSRWLSLLSTRLGEGGERDAARLTVQARRDLDPVCKRLERRQIHH